VLIEHDFGLFGIWSEAFEDHLPYLVAPLDCPIVATCHTVLEEVSRSVEDAMRGLLQVSAKIVVMTEVARDRIVQRYGYDADHVVVIAHGAPAPFPAGRREAKRRLQLDGRFVLLMFGFLDRRKGIET